MVRNNRSRNRKLSKKRVKIAGEQAGGSPAYRLHGNLGLLSQSSLDYSPLGLTTYQQGFSDHIVSTTGGGRRRTRNRKNRNRRSSRSLRRRSRSRRSSRS